jgi:hypothetical protein
VRAPKDRSLIRCYNCGTKGHYSNKCPLPKKEDDAAAPTPADVTDGTTNVKTGKKFIIAGEKFEEITSEYYEEYEEFEEFAFHQSDTQVDNNCILLDN